MTLYYPNEVFSTFAFLGFLMCCIPFPWHLEAWNTGTCLFMGWTGLACLNLFINSVVWKGNVVNWAPVWCDISARIILGANVAIPAACLCINRRLYHISTVRSVTITRAEKRRAVIVDLVIGLGIPILVMALAYISQGHRFDIYEDFGCFPFNYNTPVGIVIVSVPPILIGIASAIYGALSIRSFLRLQSHFKEVLSGHSNLNTNRYLRLVILSAFETACDVPLGIFALVVNCMHVDPWKGWDDTHSNFSFVGQFPGVFWRSSPVANGLEATRWQAVGCAIAFFLLFGFAEEARKNYRSAAQSVAKHVGVSSGMFSWAETRSETSYIGSRPSSSQGDVLPVFVKRDVLRKHDSFDTFSDVSASIGGTLTEKDASSQDGIQHVMPALTYDGLVVADVGATLADYKPRPRSPNPSSSISSVSSVSSPPQDTRPNPATPGLDDSFMEVSSPRHSFDGPSSPV